MSALHQALIEKLEAAPVNVLLKDSDSSPVVWIFDPHDRAGGVAHHTMHDESDIEPVIRQIEVRASILRDAQERAAEPSQQATPTVRWSKEQAAEALRRLLPQTQLSEARVRQVLSDTLKQVEGLPPSENLAPLERAIMLATKTLWAEEKDKGLRPR